MVAAMKARRLAASFAALLLISSQAAFTQTRAAARPGLSLALSPGLTYPLVPGGDSFAPGFSAEISADLPLATVPGLSVLGGLRWDLTPQQGSSSAVTGLAALAGASWRLPLPWGLSARGLAEAGYSFGFGEQGPLAGPGSGPLAKLGAGLAYAAYPNLSVTLDASYLWYLSSWGGVDVAAGVSFSFPPSGQSRRPANPARPSEDNGPALAYPRRILLAVEPANASPFTREEALAASKALAGRLKESDRGLEIAEQGPAPFPQLLEERAQAAREQAARGWLLVELSERSSAPAARVVAYDMLSQKIVADRSFPLTRGHSLMEAPRENWEEVASLAAATFPDPAGNKVEVQKAATARLRLRAVPHTRVTGLPGGALDTGDRGVAAVELPIPSSYTLRATAAGYQPSTQTVFLLEEREVTITQRPGARWRLDLSFQDAAFPGLDAAFFLVPDWLFVQAGLTTFQIGLAVNPDQVFFSYPLLDARLLAGSYLGPEDWGMRPYIAAGAFLRVIYPAGQSLQIDLTAPFGAQVSLGADFTLSPMSRFFLEYLPMVYFTAYPSLLHQATGTNDQPGYILFRGGAVSLLNARFGFRWCL